jgi:hypothetical protein
MGGRSSAILVLATLVASACAGKSTGGAATQGDPCPGLCEKGAKCPGAPPLVDTCDNTCLAQDGLAEFSGCHDKYQKSIDCSAKLANVCTALVDCKTEIAAAHDCEVAYCNAHRSDDVCVGVM